MGVGYNPDTDNNWGATWKAIAAGNGITVTSLFCWNTAGLCWGGWAIGRNPGTGGLTYTIPAGYNFMKVDFQCLFNGIIYAYYNGVKIADAHPGQFYSLSFPVVPGKQLYFGIGPANGGISKDLKITLQLLCDTYVTHECNASQDVSCQVCKLCSPGFYANNTCSTNYGNDRLDTQCAPVV